MDEILEKTFDLLPESARTVIEEHPKAAQNSLVSVFMMGMTFASGAPDEAKKIQTEVLKMMGNIVLKNV
jgi:hypothetical protein